jgi:hypothetical protein
MRNGAADTFQILVVDPNRLRDCAAGKGLLPTTRLPINEEQEYFLTIRKPRPYRPGPLEAVSRDSVGDGDRLSTVLRNHKKNEHRFRVTIVMVRAGGKEVTMPRGAGLSTHTSLDGPVLLDFPESHPKCCHSAEAQQFCINGRFERTVERFKLTGCKPHVTHDRDREVNPVYAVTVLPERQGHGSLLRKRSRYILTTACANLRVRRVVFSAMDSSSSSGVPIVAVRSRRSVGVDALEPTYLPNTTLTPRTRWT